MNDSFDNEWKAPEGKIYDRDASNIRDQVSLLSRGEIIARLDELEKAEYLKVLQSAMCYSPRRPTGLAPFLCPRCDSLTIHSESLEPYLVGIEDSRWTIDCLNDRLKQECSTIVFDLDDRPLCKRCSGGKTEDKAYLIVRFSATEEHRTPILNAFDDIGALEALFEGKRYVGTSNLRKFVPRLRRLLGLKGKRNG